MFPGFAALQVGLGLYDTYNQYQAEGERSKFEQQSYANNAALLRLQAADATRRGDLSAGDSRRQSAGVLGSQRAAFAGQGVDVNSGSAAAVGAEDTAIAKNEEDTIKNNAWREAWGLNAQADNLGIEARMKKLESKNKQFNTLLTGGMNALTDLANSKMTAPRYPGTGSSSAINGGNRFSVAPDGYAGANGGN